MSARFCSNQFTYKLLFLPSISQWQLLKCSNKLFFVNEYKYIKLEYTLWPVVEDSVKDICKILKLYIEVEKKFLRGNYSFLNIFKAMIKKKKSSNLLVSIGNLPLVPKMYYTNNRWSIQWQEQWNSVRNTWETSNIKLL